MMCYRLLSWAFLLLASGPLLAHPITDAAEMPYAGPASLEDRGSLDDMEQMFPLQDDYRYSTFLSGETSRDGARTSGLLPRGVKKEVLLEKQHLLDPFSQALGIRKQLRKRTGNNECFWKYCV
ncbi:urotensin 2, alpha isoform X1 [Takifugu rubripes]|uniref:Urotensin 2, alpha n=1 Tax=Takifugu rubripes TaxID=31033 RepID=H2UDL8_TAKRU|nr:urotensin II isoform X1 [Takifugu rubripes]